VATDLKVRTVVLHEAERWKTCGSETLDRQLSMTLDVELHDLLLPPIVTMSMIAVRTATNASDTTHHLSEHDLSTTDLHDADADEKLLLHSRAPPLGLARMGGVERPCLPSERWTLCLCVSYTRRVVMMNPGPLHILVCRVFFITTRREARI